MCVRGAPHRMTFLPGAKRTGTSAAEAGSVKEMSAHMARNGVPPTSSRVLDLHTVRECSCVYLTVGH